MKDDIFYGFLFYITIVGLAFLLAPLLTYLFLIIGALFAGVGFILDIIFSIVLWWAGYEGGIGETIMSWVDVMSPTAAWLIFTGIVTIVFLKSLKDIWVANEKDAKVCRKNKKMAVKIKESSPEPAYPPNISPEGEMVLSLRNDYKKGKKTMEEANKFIRVAINIWAENNHCKEKADEMYEKYKVDEKLLNDDKK